MNADVVIIGGGPAGAAAVWALGRTAPDLRVVLLERNAQLATGSSLASLECFRSCWPIECIKQQMDRSIEVFTHADEYLGAGAQQALAVRMQGYLFCGFTDKQAAGLKNDVDRLHSIGLSHIQYLDETEVQKRFGWLGPKLIAAKFDPMAGWLDSNALTTRMAYSNPNAQMIFNAHDIRILTEGRRVTGVESSQGVIHAPRVVLANGAWARAVGKTAGVDVPVVVKARQSVTVHQRHAAFPADGPMVIANGPHMRPEASKGAIFGWEYKWTPKYVPHGPHGEDFLVEPYQPIEALKDPRYPSIVAMLLGRQFGHGPGEGFNDPCYTRGVSHNIGYYVFRDESVAYQTTDEGEHHPYESERAIIDYAPEVEGLIYSVAHVGHGIMTAPAAGEIVASLVLDQPLPHPAYADFGLKAAFAEYDMAVL
jgi:glycine/D-amino acid oxidase-like deaminating enzyme